MAIFQSRLAGYCLTMKIGGANYHFSFVPQGNPYTGGLLSVANEKIAAALCKHPQYGNIFTRIDTPEVKEEPKETKKTYIASYPDVTKSQEAKEILVNKYSADATKLTGKAAILKVAEELNIEFPNLK